MKRFTFIFLLFSMLLSSCIEKIGQGTIEVSETDVVFESSSAQKTVLLDGDSYAFELTETDSSGKTIRVASQYVDPTTGAVSCGVEWLTATLSKDSIILSVNENSSANDRYAVLHIFDPLAMKQPVDISIIQHYLAQ